MYQIQRQYRSQGDGLHLIEVNKIRVPEIEHVTVVVEDSSCEIQGVYLAQSGRPQILDTQNVFPPYMRRLDRAKIDEMLIRQGVGILAMIDGEQPYAIPMSFGYDADQAVFPMQWGGGYDGRKNQAIESNQNVCLTVYEQDTEEEAVWRSIIITGDLHEVSEEREQQAYASLAANAQFAPDLGVWGAPFEDVEFRLFGLDTTNCTGREFSTEYTDWDVETPD